jgi:hypothetical protein
MRCLFCKSDTRDSVSVEHIMPESLGNTDHILPRGWVCDACNNYFARKVEKPFLDSLFGTSTRSIMGVPNKRGRVPPIRGLHPQSRSIIELMRSEDGWSVGVAPGQDEAQWVRSLTTSKGGSFYIPMPPDLPEANSETTRFIGKVALEVLAAKCQDVDGWNTELVDHPALDELRAYVRLGATAFVWPIGIRRIYDRERRFRDRAVEDYEVLHEWMILSTAGGEYYCVIAIFGVEFVINLGGPELDGWNAWLAANGTRSPLFEAPTQDGGVSE